MSPIKAFIIHGYTASPQANWFPWLAARLEEQGIQTRVLAMPDPHTPDPAAWDAHLAASIGEADGHTLLVGHSLSCISALRYLHQHPPLNNLGGLLLVSGFDEPLDTLPELTPFVAQPLPLAHIRARLPRCALIASTDDAIVPPPSSHALAQRLQAPLHQIAQGGHFLDREGFTELPLAYELLMQMAGAIRAAATIPQAS
ncbi:RBBP9/YdeN family alpha/beta hydrolase [Aeromonas crassostreae]